MPGLGIDVTLKGGALDSVQSLAAGLAPARLNPIVGRAARNTYREHLFGINSQRPNALGGARTNFYAGAARGTHFRVEGDGVIVSINQVGIGLRYYGGTVKPRTKKYLTIPAIPEAHGKRASEFSGLRFAIVFDQSAGSNGLYRPALVQGAATLIATRRGRDGARRSRAIGERQHRVVYWLAKQATSKPDPTVLPRPELVQAQAIRAVEAYAKLLWDRRNPPKNGASD